MSSEMWYAINHPFQNFNFNRWRLRIDKLFQPALRNKCNYSSMPGLKLTHVWCFTLVFVFLLRHQRSEDMITLNGISCHVSLRSHFACVARYTGKIYVFYSRTRKISYRDYRRYQSDDYTVENHWFQPVYFQLFLVVSDKIISVIIWHFRK